MSLTYHCQWGTSCDHFMRGLSCHLKGQLRALSSSMLYSYKASTTTGVLVSVAVERNRIILAQHMKTNSGCYPTYLYKCIFNILNPLPNNTQKNICFPTTIFPGVLHFCFPQPFGHPLVNSLTSGNSDNSAEGRRGANEF